jgi:alpha-amylase
MEAAASQPALTDGRVMLQGFYWESYRHGLQPGYGQRRWYEIVRQKVGAIAEAGFDLVWLPPPSWAGERSAGYNPKQTFNLSNSYGDALQQRALLVALLQAGVEPVADIVINHRDGNTGWADFRNPSWGVWSICRSDEAFSRPESGVAGTPISQRGNCEEPEPYRRGGTHNYADFRDIAHTDPRVRADIIRHLLQLRSIGYAAGATTWCMAMGRGGLPVTTPPPSPRSRWGNTTGAPTPSSAAGSGPPPASRPCGVPPI